MPLFALGFLLVALMGISTYRKSRQPHVRLELQEGPDEEFDMNLYFSAEEIWDWGTATLVMSPICLFFAGVVLFVSTGTPAP